MAPLSILPGRVRFEDPRLVGNETLSRHLESKITELAGVDLVSASHRTGRILVEFNEDQLVRDDLVARIGLTLAGAVTVMESGDKRIKVPAMPGKESPFLSGSFLTDIALHLLLPGPLDLLLPAIESAFKRGQPQPCTP